MTLQADIEQRLQILVLEISDSKRNTDIISLIHQTSWDIRNKAIEDCSLVLSTSLENQKELKQIILEKGV